MQQVGHAGTICMRPCSLLGANYMRQAASRMQTLHALAASTVQRHQFFEEFLFEFKNEDAIKKSENLRDTCAC
jgi:hypothetical protein